MRRGAKGFTLYGGLYARAALTDPKGRFSRKELEKLAADAEGMIARKRDGVIAEWAGKGLIAVAVEGGKGA